MKLNILIEQYILYRQILGAKFENNVRILKRYLVEMGTNIEIDTICPKNVEAFIFDPNVKVSYQVGKYRALNGFYKYTISRGYLKVSPLPLPEELPKTPIFIPYIYTHQEIRKLLSAVYTYEKQRHKNSLKLPTIRALLILLYGAGLRIGEAISLLMKDVDLDKSIVIIRESKFYKTRLVPIGTQLSQEMASYLEWRNQQDYLGNPESPFFIGNQANPVSKSTIEKIFRKLCKETDIYRIGDSRMQPRLHDLRHAFAVHRLTSWYQQKADVQQLLPLLSTYLGHRDLSSTTVYLSMTPMLLDQANTKFENYVFKGEENE